MIRPPVPATRANSKSHVHGRFPLDGSSFFFVRETRGRWICACACGFDALIEFNAAQFGPGPTLLLTRRAKDEPQWPSVSQAEMGDYVTGIAIGMPRRMSQEMLVDGRW